MGKMYQFIKNNKVWIFFILIYLFGIYTYWVIHEFSFVLSLYNAAALFALDVRLDQVPKVDTEPLKYYYTYMAALLAALFTIGTILGLLLQKTLTNLNLKIQKRKIFILVCGLGKKSSYYIDSEIDKGNKNIIVIEKDPNNLYIEKYQDKGVAVKIGDASNDDILRDLNIENAKYIVALAGKDTTNLEIALTVKDVLKEEVETQDNTLKDFYMHVEDRDLNIFYKDGGLLDDESRLLVKMFSMSRNSAKSLFLEHDIDGISRKYIDSSRSFSIVVVGNTNLALEVVGQACEIAHFPNENDMNIYCIDKNIKDFEKLVKHKYNNIELIPNIQLEYRELDYQSVEFYKDEFWKKDITNVILCYEDAQKNLDIAAQLADTTYFQDINSGIMQTKILIAIYENEKISESIQKNQEQFEYFDVFAQTSKMSSRKMIIDESLETVSKCIHSSYGENYNPWRLYNKECREHQMEQIECDWIDTERLSDRDSSRAQAYHIPIKLKSMGLIQKETSIDIDTLNRLENNKDIFNNKKDFLGINSVNGIEENRDRLNLNDTSLESITKEYPSNNRDKIEVFHKVFFPKKYDSLFEKLLRAEHNRWNAHHYLKGWNYAEVKDKAQKKHDCLVPLSQLKEDKKYTILYDIYSLLYIPNFLTKVKYELKIPLTIGVTGHRELINISQIIDLLKSELENISQVYDFQEIISPLAEGADTLVAKYLLDNYVDINMLVPMPVEEKVYLQQFLTENGREEFRELKKKASRLYAVGKNVDKNIYMAMGKKIVDKSDLLIALWDGKPSKGLGGTADVVAYGKECNKPILYINTDTLKVSKINFKERK